jgi:hypothetical protein
MYSRDFIAQWDLAGRKEITVTIAHVVRKSVKQRSGETKKVPVVYFEKAEKGWILNVTNGDAIAAMYGPMTENWVGKQVTLYVDPSVTVGRQKTGGIRVRPTPPVGQESEEIVHVEPPPGALEAMDDAFAQADGGANGSR